MSKNRYFILTSKSYIKKNKSFMDYLKSGVQIGLSIAIDFTGSNGNPKDPNINLIPNVIEVYHSALNKVKLWGPTNF